MTDQEMRDYFLVFLYNKYAFFRFDKNQNNIQKLTILFIIRNMVSCTSDSENHTMEGCSYNRL
jgi:hypothetical protein